MVIRRKSRFAAPLAVLSVALLAGCGSSSSKSKSVNTAPASSTSTPATTSTPASTSTSAASSAAGLVPPAIKSKGTLTFAEDASYAPDEFIGPDGHTVIGMDADLANALAAELGLKAKVVNVTFDQIIPGLAGGRYDIGLSSFTDTKAREKVVNFVTYANVGESFYTKSSGGKTIGSIADICGLTIAVEATTTEQADATAQGKKCTQAGKPGVTVRVFPTQTLANLAVASGRADLGFADTPVAGYQVTKTHGMFKLTGAEYAPSPYGIAIPKAAGTLDKAIEAALIDLIHNGTYGKIFAKWGVQSIAIPASAVKINGAIS